MNPIGTLKNSDVIINGVLRPQSCANYHCSNNSEYLESPFCGQCIWELWVHIDNTQPEQKKALARTGRIEEIHLLEAQWEEQDRLEREEIKRERMTQPGTIYYLLVGGLIKIGFTSDLGQRMRQYPPNSTLLAKHPGTRETERQMHHRFLHSLAEGREWFAPNDALSHHMEEVNARYAPTPERSTQ